MKHFVNPLKKYWKRTVTLVSSICSFVFIKSNVVLANEYEWLEDKGTALNNVNSQVKINGASYIRMLISICTTVLAIGLIIAAVRLKSTNIRNREDAKSHLANLLLGGGVLAGIFSIVSIIAQTAAKL